MIIRLKTTPSHVLPSEVHAGEPVWVNNSLYIGSADGSSWIRVSAGEDLTTYWGSIEGTLSDQDDLSEALGGKADLSALSTKQDILISGENIKTINNQSVIGSGNLEISAGETYLPGTGIDISDSTISVEPSEIDYSELSNLPTIPTTTSQLTNNSGFITSADIPITSVSYNQAHNSANLVVNGASTSMMAVVGSSDSDCISGTVTMYGPSVTSGTSTDGTFNIAGMHQFTNKNYLRLVPETATAPSGYSFSRNESGNDASTVQTSSIATNFSNGLKSGGKDVVVSSSGTIIMPQVTSSDAGKVLMVNSSGQWSAETIRTNVFYTGSEAPSDSMGDNGDIYLQIE